VKALGSRIVLVGISFKYLYGGQRGFTHVQLDNRYARVFFETS
jgi:hypothetical protein